MVQARAPPPPLPRAAHCTAEHADELVASVNPSSAALALRLGNATAAPYSCVDVGPAQVFAPQSGVWTEARAAAEHSAYVLARAGGWQHRAGNKEIYAQKQGKCRATTSLWDLDQLVGIRISAKALGFRV